MSAIEFPDRTDRLPYLLARPSNGFDLLLDPATAPDGAYCVRLDHESRAIQYRRSLKQAQSNPRGGNAYGWDATRIIVERVGDVVYLIDVTNPDAKPYFDALQDMITDDLVLRRQTAHEKRMERARQTAARYRERQAARRSEG